MYSRKRFRALGVLSLALLSLFLTACGGGDDDASKTTGTTVTQAETPDLTGTELTAWVPPILTAAQKDLFKKFEAATGAKVKMRVFPLPFEQNLLTKWATGDRPDILSWNAIGNWVVQLNPEKNLVDLGDQEFVKKIPSWYLDSSGRFRGTVYAALLDFPTVDGGFYNKPLFAKLGIKPPTNYDELLTVCETIKKEAPGVSPLVTGGGDVWPLQVPAFTFWNDDLKDDPELVAGLNSNKTKFTDPRFVAGIQKLKDLVDKGCYNKDILTAKFTDEQKRIVNGKAGMSIQVTDMVPLMVDSFGAKKVNENVGFFPISSRSTVASWQAPATAFFVPKTGNQKKEDAAKAFIQWATGPGYQPYINAQKVFPVIEGAKDPAGIVEPLIEARKALEADPIAQFQQTLEASYGTFEVYLQEMVAGKKTPEEVAAQLQREFEKSAKLVGLEGF